MKKNFDFPKTLLINIDPWSLVDENIKPGKLTTDHIQVSTCYLVNTSGGWNSPLLTDEHFQDLIQTDLDWSKIKSLYRYPHLDLSRDKLSLLKDKYGTKVVRDPNKADVRVISKKFLTKLISTSYRSSLSSASSIMKILQNNENNMDLRIQKGIQAMGKIIKEKNIDKVIVTTGHGYYHGNNNNYVVDMMNELDKVTTSSYASYIKGDNKTKLEGLQDPSIVFVDDLYVNKVTSEDSIAIDHTNFEQVNNMLKSTADRSVGMTMMANCNIEESVTWLGILFYHNWENMKGDKIWNQVAFKTLKKQFDKYHFGYHSNDLSTYSSLIRLLIEDNALTIEAVNHIQKLVFDEVLCGWNKFNVKEQLFEIDLDAVRLTNEAQSKIIKGESLSEQAKNANVLAEYSDKVLPF